MASSSAAPVRGAARSRVSSSRAAFAARRSMAAKSGAAWRSPREGCFPMASKSMTGTSALGRASSREAPREGAAGRPGAVRRCGLRPRGDGCFGSGSSVRRGASGLSRPAACPPVRSVREPNTLFSRSSISFFMMLPFPYNAHKQAFHSGWRLVAPKALAATLSLSLFLLLRNKSLSGWPRAVPGPRPKKQPQAVFWHHPYAPEFQCCRHIYHRSACHPCRLPGRRPIEA